MDLQQQAASLSEPCRSCGHALGTNQIPFPATIAHKKTPSPVANVAFNVVKLPSYYQLDVFVIFMVSHYPVDYPKNVDPLQIFSPLFAAVCLNSTCVCLWHLEGLISRAVCTLFLKK